MTQNLPKRAPQKPGNDFRIPRPQPFWLRAKSIKPFQSGFLNFSGADGINPAWKSKALPRELQILPAPNNVPPRHRFRSKTQRRSIAPPFANSRSKRRCEASEIYLKDVTFQKMTSHEPTLLDRFAVSNQPYWFVEQTLLVRFTFSNQPCLFGKSQLAEITNQVTGDKVAFLNPCGDGRWDTQRYIGKIAAGRSVFAGEGDAFHAHALC